MIYERFGRSILNMNIMLKFIGIERQYTFHLRFYKMLLFSEQGQQVRMRYKSEKLKKIKAAENNEFTGEFMKNYWS